MKKFLLAAALTIGSSTILLALDRLPSTILQKIEKEADIVKSHEAHKRMWQIYHDSLWVHVAPIFKEKFDTHFTKEHMAKTLFHIRTQADNKAFSTDFFNGIETWSTMKPETQNIIITSFRETYTEMPRNTETLSGMLIQIKDALFEDKPLPLPDIYTIQIAKIQKSGGAEEKRKYLVCLQSIISSTYHVMKYIEQLGAAK